MCSIADRHENIQVFKMYTLQYINIITSRIPKVTGHNYATECLHNVAEIFIFFFIKLISMRILFLIYKTIKLYLFSKNLPERVDTFIICIFFLDDFLLLNVLDILYLHDLKFLAT